jgi:hypothetical protein
VVDVGIGTPRALDERVVVTSAFERAVELPHAPTNAIERAATGHACAIALRLRLKLAPPLPRSITTVRGRRAELTAARPKFERLPERQSLAGTRAKP